ncbi:MFS transporter, partial [Saccharothrix sp. NEAU-S10]|nr:MFS transporter [Saccharothrix luteola]
MPFGEVGVRSGQRRPGRVVQRRGHARVPPSSSRLRESSAPPGRSVHHLIALGGIRPGLNGVSIRVPRVGAVADVRFARGLRLPVPARGRRDDRRQRVVGGGRPGTRAAGKLALGGDAHPRQPTRRALVGAAVFVVAAAVPFGLDAASFVIAAVLVAALRGLPAQAPVQRRTVRAEIGEGLRRLWRHEVLRTLGLCLCLCLMNLTLMGALSIMVLYAGERPGLDPRWFGLPLSTIAVGGVPGTAVAGRLVDRFGPTALLRVGLVVEAGTHPGLAPARDVWVAGAVLAVFGVHAVVWNVITQSIRQREVPDELRGRAGSAFFLLSVGGSALGALVGGLPARQFGITTPFWFAVVVVAGVAAVG